MDLSGLPLNVKARLCYVVLLNLAKDGIGRTTTNDLSRILLSDEHEVVEILQSLREHIRFEFVHGKILYVCNKHCLSQKSTLKKSAKTISQHHTRKSRKPLRKNQEFLQFIEEEGLLPHLPRPLKEKVAETLSVIARSRTKTMALAEGLTRQIIERLDTVKPVVLARALDDYLNKAGHLVVHTYRENYLYGIIRNRQKEDDLAQELPARHRKKSSDPSLVNLSLLQEIRNERKASH